MGGERPDNGAAKQLHQDTEAVICPRRSISCAQIDAQGGERPVIGAARI